MEWLETLSLCQVFLEGQMGARDLGDQAGLGARPSASHQGL